MVIDRMPPGCGPAFLGSAEELAAYEKTKTADRGGPSSWAAIDKQPSAGKVYGVSPHSLTE